MQTATPMKPKMNLREHGPMLSEILNVALTSTKLKKPPKVVVPVQKWERFAVNPPSTELEASFKLWSGADGNRYNGKIPPSMICQWALPYTTRMLQGRGLNLMNVINYGCDIASVAPIPSGEPIQLTTRVASIVSEEGKKHVHQEIIATNMQGKEALRANFFTLFKTGKSKKQASKSRHEHTDEWQHRAGWHVSDDDGLNFAKVTGDYNPIHWSDFFARRIGFRGRVLQGFGSMVKTYEALQNSIDQEITHIEFRFLKPVYLPSKIGVFTAIDDKSQNQLRFKAASSNTDIHVIGRVVF